MRCSHCDKTTLQKNDQTSCLGYGASKQQLMPWETSSAIAKCSLDNLDKRNIGLLWRSCLENVCLEDARLHIYVALQSLELSQAYSQVVSGGGDVCFVIPNEIVQIWPKSLRDDKLAAKRRPVTKATHGIYGITCVERDIIGTPAGWLAVNRCINNTESPATRSVLESRGRRDHHEEILQ